MSDSKFFDDCRTMFMSDGWKAFQQEIQVAAHAINVSSLETAEDFWKAKGRMEILMQIMGWENAVLAAEEQADE